MGLLLRAGHAYALYSSLESIIERERIILADMPELFVTSLELAREHGRIKGTSSCTVPAAAPGTVFPYEGSVRPI